ncbi:MAG: hypothetical protein MJZ52_07070 [Bacteroidales bacterium]|nr:hypothetical protein [Bacteroidales bacterium]
MACNISNRFPSLSPLSIRRERFHEVIVLIDRMNHDTESKEKKPTGKHYEKGENGKTRIYVPVVEY